MTKRTHIPGRDRVTLDFQGFTLSGEVVSGDTEGDPGIPNGTHTLSPYVEELTLSVEGYDHTENVIPEFYTLAEAILLAEWRETR